MLMAGAVSQGVVGRSWQSWRWGWCLPPVSPWRLSRLGETRRGRCRQTRTGEPVAAAACSMTPSERRGFLSVGAGPSPWPR